MKVFVEGVKVFQALSRVYLTEVYRLGQAPHSILVVNDFVFP
jgi:hypothetical protein